MRWDPCERGNYAHSTCATLKMKHTRKHTHTQRRTWPRTNKSSWFYTGSIIIIIMVSSQIADLQRKQGETEFAHYKLIQSAIELHARLWWTQSTLSANAYHLHLFYLEFLRPQILCKFSIIHDVGAAAADIRSRSLCTIALLCILYLHAHTLCNATAETRQFVRPFRH